MLRVSGIANEAPLAAASIMFRSELKKKKKKKMMLNQSFQHYCNIQYKTSKNQCCLDVELMSNQCQKIVVNLNALSTSKLSAEYVAIY